ncbi:hypothetical protein OIU74_024473 [Salix koriyanagi]|uniref:Leucine-rich repeat-containing N-terminal plant-type domain-containing protein n=1 Tax=Salix koriyanagi TaxID=2511006 RepID=A0A9Q1A829_9ROSI|nr:hypothetical protein OIU74_024473 [Salix koriyanagi]
MRNPFGFQNFKILLGYFWETAISEGPIFPYSKSKSTPHEDLPGFNKQALLDFAAAVPHLRKLNWNPASSVCNSWVGVTCNHTRVSELRLPGVGLVGHIPSNTIGKLDALRVLSLRSNVLEAHCSGSLIQFFHRHHSSNISKFNKTYWVEPPK